FREAYFHTAVAARNFEPDITRRAWRLERRRLGLGFRRLRSLGRFSRNTAGTLGYGFMLRPHGIRNLRTVPSGGDGGSLYLVGLHGLRFSLPFRTSERFHPVLRFLVR